MFSEVEAAASLLSVGGFVGLIYDPTRIPVLVGSRVRFPMFPTSLNLYG